MLWSAFWCSFDVTVLPTDVSTFVVAGTAAFTSVQDLTSGTPSRSASQDGDANRLCAGCPSPTLFLFVSAASHLVPLWGRQEVPGGPDGGRCAADGEPGILGTAVCAVRHARVARVHPVPLCVVEVRLLPLCRASKYRVSREPSARSVVRERGARYVWRPFSPPSSQTRPQPLVGYGVELQVKSTEYSALNVNGKAVTDDCCVTRTVHRWWHHAVPDVIASLYVYSCPLPQPIDAVDFRRGGGEAAVG